MRIDKDLIIPYSLAIGVFNLLFTLILTAIAMAIFSWGFSWELLWNNYIMGYITLWLLNLKVIRK